MTIASLIIGALILVGTGNAIYCAGANAQWRADQDVINAQRAEIVRLSDPSADSKAHHPAFTAVPASPTVLDRATGGNVIPIRRRGPEPAA